MCIPKSARPERIADNFAVWDWELDRTDMEALDRLDADFRYGIGFMPGHYNCSNAPWGVDGKGRREES